MNSPYIILEKAVHGKRTFPENTEAYVQSPMFVRLLTMISDVDRISSMRYTDTLTDFTTGIIWPKDWNIFTPPNKKHDFFELVYVYEGTLKLRIEQQIYAFEKGSVFSLDLHLRSALMPSRYSAFFLGISKDFFSDAPSKYEHILCLQSNFLHHIRWNLLHPSESHGFFLFQEKQSSVMMEMMTQFQKELSQKQAGYSMFLFGYILRIISVLENEQFFSHQYIELKVKTPQGITTQIQSFLQTHPYRLCMNELANELQLNYAPEYLNKIYKSNTNESISETNRRIYLEEALRLLTTTNLTVSAVCKRLHFHDRKSFYVAFKGKFGCTPAEYRQKHVKLCSAANIPPENDESNIQ